MPRLPREITILLKERSPLLIVCFSPSPFIKSKLSTDWAIDPWYNEPPWVPVLRPPATVSPSHSARQVKLRLLSHKILCSCLNCTPGLISISFPSILITGILGSLILVPFVSKIPFFEVLLPIAFK